MNIEKLLIKKVYSFKGGKQKFVTIPQKSNIEVGDYVFIEKVEKHGRH